ncbi:integrase core domain-containing protein [Anatilimnocola sp. NA78]|uniref:integrase core domain-containing protein n=1 Tax=Anatilimnocola sp. NA78 TaxID=3415683 RepID=UPI003CE44BA6
MNEFRSPNTNAFVERFAQSIQQVCLDRFVIFGEQHMDHVCQAYLEHCHNERPHQGIENELTIRPEMTRSPLVATITLDEIRSTDIGGRQLKIALGIQGLIARI